MKTILELLSEIEKSTKELTQAVNELSMPFAGMIDTEAIEQVEDERNKDHYEAEQI